MMKSATKTPNTITKAINEFVETASKKFPEIESMVVFGSVARGTYFGLIIRTPEEIKYLIKLGSPLMDAILTDGKIKYGTETFKRTCGEGIGIGAGVPA